MFRRILITLTSFGVLLAFAIAAGAFFLVDPFLLQQTRSRVSQLAPGRIEISDLHSRLLGPVEVSLGGIVATEDAGTIKIREVKIASRLGVFALFSAYRAHEELPLTVVLSGVEASFPEFPRSAKTPAKAAPRLAPLSFPVSSPVPVNLEISLVSGEVHGPFVAKDISLKFSVLARASGAEIAGEAKLLLGAPGALLPVTANAKVSATAALITLQNFSLRAAGLEGSATGKLSTQPLRGEGSFQVEAPDLSRVALRPEDRAALGLSATPSGSLSLRTSVELKTGGEIAASGLLRIPPSILPLKAPEGTAYASLAAGRHVEGNVGIQAELPFRAILPAGDEPVWKFTSDRASLAVDFSSALLVSPGQISKPAGIPLRAEIVGALAEKSVHVESLRANFHSLKLAASGDLPFPLGDSVDTNFRLDVASLAGFPALLPMLRSASEAASLADAEGSLHAEGRLRATGSRLADSAVELKNVTVKNLSLPLAFESPGLIARGLLTGAASGQGKYVAGDLDVERTKGSFDLTGLELNIPGKLDKKRGRKLVFAFDAGGSPSRLQIRKISLTAEGLAATLSGGASFGAKRAALLSLSGTTRAELGPLREYLPILPLKVSGGVLDAQMQVGGTWVPELGIQKSPLTLRAKATAKLGSVVMPETLAGEVAPKSKAPPSALLPDWPIARNANVAYRMDIASFQRGALAAEGVSLHGTLKDGSLLAAAEILRVFGGKASLRQLSGSLLDPHLALRGQASAVGIDLSQAAGFANPEYAKAFKGALDAEASFLVPNAWSESLLQTVAAEGRVDLHNASLSTASLDGLVNEKLKSIPGLGVAKLTTGGLAAEVKAAFQLANGQVTLANLLATTPAHDEMRLNGILNLRFDCDLSGEAHLAHAPVAGAVREANSDAEGRLVVPVRFRGNLKDPKVEIATNMIEAMLRKTALREGDKLKAKAVDAVKARAEDSLKGAADGLLDQLKKNLPH